MAIAASRWQPAQHIAAEWVWMRCRPRYSQMPASGSKRLCGGAVAERFEQMEQALVARPRQAAVEEHRHGGEDDAAIGVVLHLIDRGIADAHRAVAAIAFEVGRGAFLDDCSSARRCRAAAALDRASPRSTA